MRSLFSLVGFLWTTSIGAQQPPDFIVFITDDQAAHEDYLTPLANAAIGGVDFQEGVQHTTICDPARCTILTGQYRHRHGVNNNNDDLECPDTKTFPFYLHQAGYRTGLFGKYMAAWPGGDPPGWSVFERGWNKAYAAAEFVRETALDRPLLVYVGFQHPHWPAIPEPEDVGTFDTLPPWRPGNFNEADVSDKPEWIRDLALLSAAEKDTLDAFVQRRAETLREVDRGIMAVLDAHHEARPGVPVVVIRASDHGLVMGGHRIRRAKNCIYEECLRVPFRVAAPDARERTDTSHAVSLVDLAPTILDYAGLPPQPEMDGTSFRSVVRDGGAFWPGATLHEVGSGVTQRADAIRTPWWTYAEYTNGDRELYRRWIDPWQLENLAGQPEWAAKQAELKARLEALRAP